ncbi:NADH-quinone oxidoreductase subunit J [Actinoallomurus iriomotensis]|uniref:NADH-quinone oxidoreductase subunit J n=1 Tax=Actinoallomurus iriomotensis TaxID=478107 RepID=A0A9W6RQ38_9ACTN|nr:NADH-quinone oxidoreductase subunit J [Actinoallomurus iriomotensis]GLY79921.1 NADH:ubiquinone oxidoreductase subunit J [Actinoallomurus iriomotensis]
MNAIAAGAHQTGESGIFWVLAIVSVAAALGMIFMRKVVYSALLLAVVMLSLAVFYAVNEAPFLAFVQVIVYTGAVLMLFLFVIMVVGVSSTESMVETIRGQRVAAAIAGIGFGVLLILGIGDATLPTSAGLSKANSNGGNVMGLARLLFGNNANDGSDTANALRVSNNIQGYIFAFEVTSALLITAALGAMVLAHRERLKPKPTQRELSQARIKSDQVSPLPPPGTYARHNAVDMPALLPDGSVSELSVSPVIARRRGGSHDDLHGEGPESALRHGTATVKAVLEGQVEGQVEVERAESETSESKEEKK